VRLENIDLPAGLIWADEYLSQSVSQVVKRTLDGGAVVFHSPIRSGQSITLESRADSGWLTGSQVASIKALSDASGGVFQLEIRGQLKTVVFRHDEPPAFEAEPIFPFANPMPNHFYTCRIKLMSIG